MHNPTHADQHTDQEEGIFVQRVEWELAGFAIPREEIARAGGYRYQALVMDGDDSITSGTFFNIGYSF